MEVKRDEFIKDYKTLPMETMCAKYGGVTKPTILKLASKLGIKRSQGRPGKLNIE